MKTVKVICIDEYVTLIATTDDVDEDNDEVVATGSRQNFSAPAVILNEVAGGDFKIFAECCGKLIGSIIYFKSVHALYFSEKRADLFPKSAREEYIIQDDNQTNRPT